MARMPTTEEWKRMAEEKKRQKQLAIHHRREYIHEKTRLFMKRGFSVRQAVTLAQELFSCAAQDHIH